MSVKKAQPKKKKETLAEKTVEEFVVEESAPEFTKVELTKKKARKRVVKKKKVEKKEEESKEDTEQRIQQELEDIYTDEDGTIPDMSDFQAKKRNRLLTALAVLLFSCVFLAGVAWVGFFIFQPQVRFAEEDVILSISGQEEIVAGQEVTYRVRYRNAQNMPLSKVVLQVRYPEGFVYVDSSKEPNNEKRDEWILGSLEEHDSGYLDINGRLHGNLGEKQSFRIFLNYIPSNFSSEFQKVATLNTEVKESPLVFSIESVEEVGLGVGTEFVVDIEAPEEPVKNVALIVEPVNGFSKTSSEPANDEDNIYQWSWEELSEQKVVNMIGAFNPDDSDLESVELVFKLVGWKDEERQVEPYILAVEKVTLNLLKTELSVGMAINGSAGDFSVRPGETLNTSIVLKNSGPTPLKKVSTRLIFETPSYDEKSMLDWYNLEDPENGQIKGEQINAETRRGSILWDSRHISDLWQLDPGEELNIDLSIPFKDADDVDLAQFVSYISSAVVEVKYDSGVEQKILSGNKINMVMNSDLDFEVRDKIGSDNGKELHTVTWLLSNTWHELQEIELSTDIYGDVSWQVEDLVVPAGEAKYDDKEQKFVWTVESMPTSVDILALQFAVVLDKKNPSQSNLTSKVKVKAKDVISGQDIILAGDEILLD